MEGNYLLLQEPEWAALRPYFDVTVSLDVPEAELEQRLRSRWTDAGLGPDVVSHRVETNDLPNVRLVLTNSAGADYVITRP